MKCEATAAGFAHDREDMLSTGDGLRWMGGWTSGDQQIGCDVGNGRVLFDIIQLRWCVNSLIFFESENSRLILLDKEDTSI